PLADELPAGILPPESLPVEIPPAERTLLAESKAAETPFFRMSASA
nr:hypothetical protein [Tanacetum cinerariifolium]